MLEDRLNNPDWTKPTSGAGYGTPLKNEPTKRQAAKSEAEQYGIDTKGMSTKDINSAVKNAREQVQLVAEEMGKFINATSQEFLTNKKSTEVSATRTPPAPTSRITEDRPSRLISANSSPSRKQNIPTTTHPFLLTVTGGDNPKYKVYVASSIINGTNGGPFAISDLDTDIEFSGTNFIVAEAEVTSSPFEISNDGFTISAIGDNEDDTNEVVLEDGKQTKLRLLIGKIVAETVNGETSYTVLQAVTTSFKTVVSFHNGIPVYVLQAAPTHQSRLILPTPTPPAPPPA